MPIGCIVIAVADPKGLGPAGNGGGREWAEIPAVERVGGPAVHQEDFAVADHSASLPGGQRTAAPVACERASGRLTVDGDAGADPTDGLPRKREDVLQQRHALGQVAAIGEEVRERLGRRDDDKLADMEDASWAHGIEADRHAGARIPDQPGREFDRGGERHGGD